MGKGFISVKLFDPGYLITQPGIKNFIIYWFLNLGSASILAPIGFLLADKNQRKIFLPFLALFLVGYLFRFSPEAAANHKFFNLYIVAANAFTAFVLVSLWRRNIYLRFLIVPVVFIMILSGIIDIFPILNDGYITIQDIPKNKAALFIVKNTPKNAVFLNSSYLYPPESLAGRKIMMGWPYFAWSAGYDTDSRGKLMTRIYSSHSKEEICSLLKDNFIDYFTTQDTSNDRDFPNIDLKYFSSNFSADYSDPTISIYNVRKNCN